MADLAKLVVKLEAESSQLRSELEKTNRRMQRWERKVSKSVANVGKSFARAFSGIGVAIGAAGIGAGLRRMVDEAADAQRQLAKLEGLIQSTGSAAGLTTKQIDEFARSLARSTLASTQGVRDAAGVLLSFRTVSGDTFKRTLTLAQDLSAVLGSDLRSATLQLGKALEDPVKGLSSLTESGVSFTQAEQDMIKSMQKAGRQLEAQSMILDKIAGQIGGAGSAEASGTLAGAVDTLSQNWAELLENIGNSGPLQAAIGFMDGLAQRIQTLNNLLFKSKQDEFYDLIDRRAELQQKLNNAASRSGHAGRQRNRFREELAQVEAQIRKMQDDNIARIKREGDASKAAADTRAAAVSNIIQLEDAVLKKLNKQKQTFSELLEQARGAVNKQAKNPLTEGTLIEALRALSASKTLESGGDSKSALKKASEAIEVIQKLSEAGKLSKQYANTLLDQAGKIGTDAANRMIELKLDDKKLEAEANRARRLIQANFSAEPFTAQITWTNPNTPNVPTLPQGASTAGGTPLVLNFGGKEYETNIPASDADAMRPALQREAMKRGSRC